jgi:hypothetical protein
MRSSREPALHYAYVGDLVLKARLELIERLREMSSNQRSVAMSLQDERSANDAVALRIAADVLESEVREATLGLLGVRHV